MPLYALVDKKGEFMASDDGRLFVYTDPTYISADAKELGYKLVKVKVLLDRGHGKGIAGSK